MNATEKNLLDSFFGPPGMTTEEIKKSKEEFDKKWEKSFSEDTEILESIAENSKKTLEKKRKRQKK